MSPAANEKEVIGFENKYCISLPLAYRRFIIEVADGMTIQSKNYNYRLLSLFDAEVDANKIAKSFPLKNFWVWEDDYNYSSESEYHELFESVGNGNFAFMDMGCGRSFNLIVSGDCTGEVWDFADTGVQSLQFPRRDFLSWLDFFLGNGDTFYDNFPDYDEYENLNRS